MQGPVEKVKNETEQNLTAKEALFILNHGRASYVQEPVDEVKKHTDENLKPTEALF